MVPEPAPTEPVPTEPAPTESGLGDVSSDPREDAQEQCRTEPGEDAPPIGEDSAGAPAVDEPLAAAHSVSADRPASDDQPHLDGPQPGPGTGAGLSEAGTL